jgi:hypothetical protein
MIRKQVYITRAQDLALKERARREGRHEAAILRDAIERHLLDSATADRPIGTARKLVRELRAMSQSREFKIEGGFDRASAYSDRPNRPGRA